MFPSQQVQSNETLTLQRLLHHLERPSLIFRVQSTIFLLCSSIRRSRIRLVVCISRGSDGGSHALFLLPVALDEDELRLLRSHNNGGCS